MISAAGQQASYVLDINTQLYYKTQRSLVIISCQSCDDVVDVVDDEI